MTFGDTPGSSSNSDDSTTPNYSSAIPVKWSQIRPSDQASNLPNEELIQNDIDIDIGNDHTQADPLEIFFKRNDSEQFDGSGSVDIRTKYPQLFLANHLAQLKNMEKYNNGINQHHSSSSSVSLQVVNMDVSRNMS